MTDKIKLPMQTAMHLICDANLNVIASLENGQSLDKAKYIVNCVNSHETMVAWIKLVLENAMTTTDLSDSGQARRLRIPLCQLQAIKKLLQAEEDN
jgi:hypothetical protein